MFSLEVKTSDQSQQKNSTTLRLEELLREIVSKGPPFEDHADFLLWSEESLPLVHWQKPPSPDGEISIYLLLPNDSLYWYVFNTRCFPFNHSKIRRAFAYAVDRSRILQGIPPGHWPAFSVLPFRHSQGILMEESKQKGVDLFEEALNELGLDRKSFPR